MVRWIRDLTPKVLAVIIPALIMSVVGYATAGAEGSNQFPTLNGDWAANARSPDPNLTWLFKANPPNETVTSQTTHILRNRHIGRNEGTRLRVYFKKKPRTVSVSINVIACDLDAPAKYAGNVIVNLGGGAAEYNRPTLPRSGSTGESRVCAGNSTKLDGKTYSVNYPATDTGASIGRDDTSGLYFADLDIDLTAANDPTLIPKSDQDVMQRITFTVRANNVIATDGTTTAPQMGYRYFEYEDRAERFFGLEGNGGRNETYEDYGQKLAIPFGMDCNDRRDNFGGKITLYDPDVDGYGDVYMKVFRRSPGGAAGALPAGEYTAGDRVVWEGAASRFRSTAGSNQNSSFSVNIERGYQYMLVIVNPKTKAAAPSTNVYSLRLPTNSINGLIDCRFDLRPTLSGVPSTFSYQTTLNPRGTVANAASGTAAGEHRWRMTRVVLNHRPADLSRATYVNNGSQPCNFINATSGPLMDCDYLSDDRYPNLDTRTINDPVGPYPPGTYVCYMTSVFDPTWSTADDSQWRHSTMSCSVAGVKPKVQAWGYDVKAQGVISTSVSDIGGATPGRRGSWGEYGVFSNGRNNAMASSSGLVAASNGAAQANWSNLTFATLSANSCPNATGGRFGCFGAVTKPLVSTDNATIINGDTTISSLSDSRLPSNLKGTIRITGTLRISGTELKYPDSVASVAQIPRLVIVADKIIIDPSVTRIDPWLVAVTAPANPANTGIISTCSQIGTNGGNNPSAFTTAGLLDSTRCGNKLVFNGPVIADKIYLYRTYDTAAGDAAEVFNLRADNFLSSYVGGGPTEPIARTDSIVEMPPRF